MALTECRHGRQRASSAAPRVCRDARMTMACSLIRESTMGSLFVQRFAGRLGRGRWPIRNSATTSISINLHSLTDVHALPVASQPKVRVSTARLTGITSLCLGAPLPCWSPTAPLCLTALSTSHPSGMKARTATASPVSLAPVLWLRCLP